jgi:phosphatidylinositol alpha-mannosyltransferase
MKIGLVCPYNLFKGGGVQECVLALQSELAARGHDVLIITFQPREYSGEVPEFVRLLGRGRDVKSPFNTTAQVSVTVDMDQVDELFEAEQFDVLHFHEPWVPLLSHQLLARSRAKNIATFHAKLPDTVMSRTIEKVITPYTKSLLKYFSTMTAVSDAAASYVRSLTDAEIEIVPNGIDLKKYRAMSNGLQAKNSKPDTQNSILYIGRLEKRKGVKFLLKAVHELQKTNPEVLVQIAGDGPDRQQLERYAKENKINAQFLGRVSETDKLLLLHTSRVFCSPARYGESFGIVLLEAMAVGLPVVAGDNPGYSAVLQGTGSLSLVDPSDTTEFARRLELMLTNDEVRNLWQTWASTNIKQYDYPLVVDQYEKLYKS